MRVRGKPAIGTGPPLLEREASLALLNEYAAQAAGREGRLVPAQRRGGRGEVGATRAAAPGSAGLLAGGGPGATACSRRARSGRCSTSPISSAARCRAGPGRRPAARSCSGRCCGILSAPGVLDVLVVEDVHWADEATLDLLRYLGRRLRGAAASAMVTYRDDGSGPADPLRVVLGDWVAPGHPAAAAGAVVRSEAVRHWPRAAGCPRRELHRLTGGNPFFVTEVLRSGDWTGWSVSRRGAGAGGSARRRRPRGAGRQRRLPGPGSSAAAGVGDRSPAVALDELVAGGLLVEDTAGVRFRHEMARLAVARRRAGAPRAARSPAGAVGVALVRLRGRGSPGLPRRGGGYDAAATLRYATAAVARAVRLGVIARPPRSSNGRCGPPRALIRSRSPR